MNGLSFFNFVYESFPESTSVRLANFLIAWANDFCNVLVIWLVTFKYYETARYLQRLFASDSQEKNEQLR